MTEQQTMNFETKDEFMKYYNEHKEEMDKLKTVDLNKRYKIKDSKVSRTKNVLTFKPIVVKPTPIKKDDATHSIRKNNARQEQADKNINKTVDKEIKFYDNMILLHQKQIETYKQIKNKLMCQYDVSSKEASKSSNNSKSDSSE